MTSSLASIPDHELDAYIADLIVEKSKSTEAQTSGVGHSDAKTSEPRVPNTNKRFLASVIRNVEGHNQVVLRQQAAREDRGFEPQAQDSHASRVGEGSSSREPDTSSSKLRGWSDDSTDRRDRRERDRSDRQSDRQSDRGLNSEKHRRTDDSDRKRKHREDGRDRKKRKKDERKDDESRRKRRHSESEKRSSRKREPEPTKATTTSPRKVREWDLGKDPRAF